MTWATRITIAQKWLSRPRVQFFLGAACIVWIIAASILIYREINATISLKGFNTDFSAALAGNYLIVRTSANEVTVAPDDIIFDNTPVIPKKVVEVNHDGRFIIARRENRMEPFQPDDYWILDTKKPQVYGPFNKAVWTQKKEELGISSWLSLKDVEAYYNKD